MNKNRGKKKKRNKNFLIRIIKVLLCFNSEGGFVVVVSASSEIIRVSTNVKHESRRWKPTEVTWGFQVR